MYMPVLKKDTARVDIKKKKQNRDNNICIYSQVKVIALIWETTHKLNVFKNNNVKCMVLMRTEGLIGIMGKVGRSAL